MDTKQEFLTALDAAKHHKVEVKANQNKVLQWLSEELDRVALELGPIVKETCNKDLLRSNYALYLCDTDDIDSDLEGSGVVGIDPIRDLDTVVSFWYYNKYGKQQYLKLSPTTTLRLQHYVIESLSYFLT